MSPLETLFAEHRRHYEPGTLERFKDWFAKSGHLEMLNNPWLRDGKGRTELLQIRALKFSKLRSVAFDNQGTSPWPIGFTPTLELGVTSVEALFRNLVLSTAHTHLFGDFRLNLGYYVKVYSGSRYLLFDGAGTCLLLGAMFQALAGRVLSEKIDLHYSHSANRELTHAFGSWRNEFFVDPDQKTWLPLSQVDQSAVFGYLFQQLGVSAHQIYLSLGASEREFLFAKMTRDYFEFYEGSVAQYMYQHHQDIAEVSQYFREARQKYCWPLSVDASDFPWKDELRRQAAIQGIERPYFLVHSNRTVPIDVPPGGSLSIGLDQKGLPEEARLFATLFLGRVPAALTVPVGSDGRCRVTLPEFPWLMAFDPKVSDITINGKPVVARMSRCGRYRIVGMGEFEQHFDLPGGHDEFAIDVFAPGAINATFVLPFNAFALAADLVRVDAPEGQRRTILGTIAA